MASDTVLCPGCGITLRSFMQRCPRCGAESIVPINPAKAATAQTAARGSEPAPPAATPARPVAPSAPPVTPTPAASAPRPTPPPGPPAYAVPPRPPAPATPSVDELRRYAARAPVAAAAVPDTIYVSPPDEVRRFPLFTRAQIVLMVIAAGLVIFALVIGWLLWSRDQRDTSANLGMPGLNAPPALTLPELSPTTTPDPNATPTPELSIDDQVLAEEARKVLAAYNPAGVGRYKFTVKDGVITLTGEVEHAPEKEGATNVLRLLAGAKSVVNNLVINPALAVTPTPLNQPTATPAATEANLNPAAPVPANPTAPTAVPTISEAQRAQQEENARLQRELMAARQRELELQRQREADAQRQREIEEALRQQKDAAARQAQTPVAAPPSTPAPSRSSTLRSGTVAWSGVVDGVDEIVIAGGSAAVRHLSGDAVREARSSFSASVPRAPVSVKLLSTSGRGSVQITQQPSAANGYTTIVRVDDSTNGGSKLHQFTLQWSAQ